MDKIEESINQGLEALRMQTSADFMAFACQEPGEAVIHWKYAVGNHNERLPEYCTALW